MVIFESPAPPSPSDGKQNSFPFRGYFPTNQRTSLGSPDGHVTLILPITVTQFLVPALATAIWYEYLVQTRPIKILPGTFARKVPASFKGCKLLKSWLSLPWLSLTPYEASLMENEVT